MATPINQPAGTAKPLSIDALVTEFMDKLFRWKKDARRLNARPEDQTTPPWENWELDKDFFRALSRWELANQETSLDRVFIRICDGLEQNKDLVQLIPDTPFPARGLVTALAHLFKLGVEISRAKRDVQQFTKGVIHWVGLVKSAFESPGDGLFTRQAWQNLKDMRELIDEVCMWAVKRLKDRKWSRIKHGLRIQNEIQEFIRRIADARALFQDLSSINQAKGLDIILQQFHRVERQEVIVTEIQKLREAQERHSREIMSELEMQRQVAERNHFFAETLNLHTVTDATYDGQGKRQCDKDTRMEVLDDIRKWTDDISLGTPNFLWLTGDPGCGKSAVTASLARECKDRNVLWAEFFISRNKEETTNPKKYFPSIARQMANRSPDVAETIHHILQKKRSLLDDISADQASKLFIESVVVASQVEPEQPVVIIIDGLDETNRDRLEDTAKIFSTLFTSLKTYSNVKVFISSRTDDEIQTWFNLPRDNEFIKHIHLDTADPTSIRDVSNYVKRSLFNLVSRHDLNWNEWPGDERCRVLGERASGLFIWGVTAVKFLEEQIKLHREEFLQQLLDMLTADVLRDINQLYSFILSVVLSPAEKWDSEKFRRIVGAIVFLHEPLCIDDLATLLDLRKDPSSTPVNIVHFVRRLRTILVTGADVIDGSTIPRIHKSVFEFITSDSTKADFRIEPSHAHLELAIQCITCFSAARALVTKDTLPTPFRYASRFWSSHFSQANVSGSTSFCADYRLSPSTSPLFPLAPVHMPVWIQFSSTTSRIMINAGIWDAIDGASIPHAERITSMLFSPNGRQIVSCSNDNTIMGWEPIADELMRPLVKHSSEIHAIAFSRDGESIATGSHDGSVCLWDHSTGVSIGKPFEGYKRPITCIAFSSDGERIISGSEDKTCILWNSRSGQAVGQPWSGHESPVELAAFSASGRRVCTIDGEGNGIIWEVSKGRKIRTWRYGGHPQCLSFSPKDDEFIVLGGSVGLEVRSGNRAWSILDSGDTHCVSFLPDGKQIIFAGDDTISIAEVGKDESTARIVKKGGYPCADSSYSRAFSPDLDHFAYADWSDTIHLLALKHDASSFEALPVKIGARTAWASKIDSDNELANALSRMKRTKDIQNATQETNHRLAGISWYQSDIGAAETGTRICVVRDDVVIVAYHDSVISVWEWRSLDEEQSSSEGLDR